MKQQKMVVNKDLQYERSRCTFDPVEVTHFFDGSAEKTRQRRDQEQYFLGDLVLKENVAMKYKSHKEIYEGTLRICCKVLHKIRELQRSGKADIHLVLNIFRRVLGTALFEDGNPLLLHYGMFLPALMGQANSEQQAYWINRAWTGDVIGTYAQDMERFSGVWKLRVWDMYNTVQSQLHHSDYEKLPELHSLSCCLKAVVSADTAAGIEQLRLSCGGHGYMTASNLPVLYGFATAVCTYEGENTVLLLQTARYLVESWKQAMDGKPLPESVEYLNEAAKGVKHCRWSNDLECLIDAYNAVAAGSIRLAAEHLDRRIRDGVPTEEAWNQTSIELTQCAEAHARVFIVKTFAEAIKQLNSKSEEFRQVMFQLCELYIVYWALRNVGNFLRFSSMQEEHVQTLHSRLEYLLMAIRRNAVGIVDGFDFDDHILCSVLGAYDGNVYERLFQEAMKSPLNRETANIPFEKYLKPFLKCNL
ncbi:probable peroxisomal acyl-coenzyme A oxidase 1 [Bombus affinis]|uniref:probable peroxisomal acyl-coenzyme A oxidase 1 n=1 Tax=Bombus affinis TaxID=309941 RepID=UPI0021B710D7|nr:probable peroxisomal acyl-coenzyme A oxidase 1 [Bombus affinis]